MQPYTKMRSRKFPDVIIKVIPGHFITPNTHKNYYIDMTTMKTRQNEARAAARAMASTYTSSTIIDTIVCMDGMEVIGAYLADELTNAGIMSMNAHRTIYIYTPEFDTSGQLIFRENSKMMIRGKHVLLLMASATAGKTVLRAAESIDLYGGEVVGITTAKPSMYASGGGASVEGITFAIPMDDVYTIIKDLVENGYVTGKPYLGIVMSQYGVDQAAQMYGIPAGVPVLGVAEGLAAAQAGIQENDIIVKIGDVETPTGSDLGAELAKTKPGDQVPFTIYRGGETLEVTVTIGEETAEAREATQKVNDAITEKQQKEQQQQQQGQQGQQSGGYGGFPYSWPFGFGF